MYNSKKHLPQYRNSKRVSYKVLENIKVVVSSIGFALAMVVFSYSWLMVM